MKKLFFAFLLSTASAAAFAQPEVIRDADGHKILKGLLLKKDIAADTVFAWYAQNRKGYTPPAEVLTRMAGAKDSVNYIVFGGTWCGDTQALLPKFFAVTEAAGIAENRITLIGVDRSKKAPHNLSEAFGITNVPTFIVMKNGKEIGRVVEYGKTGTPEKEVAEIAAGAKK